MKLIALATATVLSLEAVCLALPAQQQESATNRFYLPERDQVSPTAVSGSSHIDKREWRDWAPSTSCVTCIALCMASSVGDSYKFTYKVTRLTLETINTFNMCGVGCSLEGSCGAADKTSPDPFFSRNSEAARITSQYKSNGMIEGAGSDSPTGA